MAATKCVQHRTNSASAGVEFKIAHDSRAAGADSRSDDDDSSASESATKIDSKCTHVSMNQTKIIAPEWLLIAWKQRKKEFKSKIKKTEEAHTAEMEDDRAWIDKIRQYVDQTPPGYSRMSILDFEARFKQKKDEHVIAMSKMRKDFKAEKNTLRQFMLRKQKVCPPAWFSISWKRRKKTFDSEIQKMKDTYTESMRCLRQSDAFFDLTLPEPTLVDLEAHCKQKEDEHKIAMRKMRKDFKAERKAVRQWVLEHPDFVDHKSRPAVGTGYVLVSTPPAGTATFPSNEDVPTSGTTSSPGQPSAHKRLRIELTLVLKDLFGYTVVYGRRGALGIQDFYLYRPVGGEEGCNSDPQHRSHLVARSLPEVIDHLSTVPAVRAKIEKMYPQLIAKVDTIRGRNARLNLDPRNVLPPNTKRTRKRPAAIVLNASSTGTNVVKKRKTKREHLRSISPTKNKVSSGGAVVVRIAGRDSNKQYAAFCAPFSKANEKHLVVRPTHSSKGKELVKPKGVAYKKGERILTMCDPRAFDEKTWEKMIDEKNMVTFHLADGKNVTLPDDVGIHFEGRSTKKMIVDMLLVRTCHVKQGSVEAVDAACNVPMWYRMNHSSVPTTLMRKRGHNIEWTAAYDLDAETDVPLTYDYGVAADAWGYDVEVKIVPAATRSRCGLGPVDTTKLPIIMPSTSTRAEVAKQLDLPPDTLPKGETADDMYRNSKRGDYILEIRGARVKGLYLDGDVSDDDDTVSDAPGDEDDAW